VAAQNVVDMWSKRKHAGTADDEFGVKHAGYAVRAMGLCSDGLVHSITYTEQYAAHE
jgi:hypothetical protein